MSSSLTITVLVENRAARPDLGAEHGLAFWIETAADRVLFDTGQSGLVCANAKALGVDLGAVETIALSHGHYDHTGGLADVLACAAGLVAVYFHPDALPSKYHRAGPVARCIGIPGRARKALRRPQVRFCPVEEPTEIAEGVFLTGAIPRRHAEERGEEGFFLDEDGRRGDPMIDDQALYVLTPSGIVVLLGCAHAGVINTLDRVRHLAEDEALRAVIGGMHLRAASDARIAWTVDALCRREVGVLCPLHCTGERAAAAMQTAFGAKCLAGGAGARFEF